MSKHTPGPWKPENAGKGSWIQGSDGNWAALACGTDDENADANARLISAAPDLLVALKRAVSQLEERGYDGLSSGAYAAIAKAEGRK